MRCVGDCGNSGMLEIVPFVLGYDFGEGPPLTHAFPLP